MSKLDELPLYATDLQLSTAIGNFGYIAWPRFVSLYEKRGLPKVNPYFGGRYVPAVEKFLADLEKVSADGPEDLSVWAKPKSRRRGSSGAGASMGKKSPSGAREPTR